MNTPTKSKNHIQDAIICESVLNFFGIKQEIINNTLIIDGEVNSYAKKIKEKAEPSMLTGLYWPLMNIKIQFKRQ